MDEASAAHHDDPNDLLRRDLDDWSVEAATCTLVSPLLLFVEWLNELPEPVRTDAAKEVGRFLRDDPLYLELREEADPAARLLALYFQAPEAADQILRRLFVIRGAMDLLAFQYGADADDWRIRFDQARRFLPQNVILSTPQQDDEQARPWIEAAESWKRLRNSVLGDEALSCWYEIARWQQG